MMTQKEIIRHLKGRKIINAKPNAFRDGKGGWAHNWELFLDDGSRVWFIVEETETGEYGIDLGVTVAR